MKETIVVTLCFILTVVPHLLIHFKKYKIAIVSRIGSFLVCMHMIIFICPENKVCSELYSLSLTGNAIILLSVFAIYNYFLIIFEMVNLNSKV